MDLTVEFIKNIQTFQVPDYIKEFSILMALITTVRLLFLWLRRILMDDFYLSQRYKTKAFKEGVREYVPPGYVVGEHRQSVDDSWSDKEFLTNRVAAKNRLLHYLLERKRVLPWAYRWRDKQTNKVLLYGDPGIGKSLSLYMVYKRLFSTWSLLFRMHPGVALFDVTEWLSGNAEMEVSHKFREFMSKVGGTNRKSCVLLIDAFDEYVELNPLPNEKVIEKIHAIFGAFDQFKAVVIASRLSVGFPQDRYIQKITLLPFSEDDVLKSLKKRYRRKFPFSFLMRKDYPNIEARLTGQDGFLLKTISRRPLLLRYIEDLVESPYFISQDQFESITGFAKWESKRWKFEPKTSLFDYPRPDERSFVKELDREIASHNDPGVSRVLSDSGVREKLIDAAAKNGKIDSLAKIYDHILRRWHGREAKKNRVNDEQVRKAYYESMDSILMEVAWKIAQWQNPKIEKAWVLEKWNEMSGQTQASGHAAIGNSNVDFSKLDPFKRSILTALDSDYYCFLHKSFYDFYLAKMLLKVENDVETDKQEEAKKQLLLLDDSETWQFYTEMAKDKHQPQEQNLGAERIKTIEEPNLEFDLETGQLSRLVADLATNGVGSGLALLWKEHRFWLRPVEQATQQDRLKWTVTIWAILAKKTELFRIGIKQDRLRQYDRLDAVLQLTSSSFLQSAAWKFDDFGIGGVLVSLGIPEMMDAKFGEIEIGKEILRIFSESDGGWSLTTLMLAVLSNEVEMITFLMVNYPGDLDLWLEQNLNFGINALMYACMMNKREAVRVCLSNYTGHKNTWLKRVTNGGNSVLMEACSNRMPEIVRMLLEAYEGNKNAWLEHVEADGWNALIVACRHSTSESIRLLLNAYEGNKNVWLEYTNDQGWNALMVACRNNTSESIRLLLATYEGNKNAWLEQVTDDGWNALILACQYNTSESIRLLLDAYAGSKNTWLEFTDDSWNVLTTACRYNTSETVRLLLESYGGSKNRWLNHVQNDGWNALIVACQYNTSETVRLLLAAYEGDKRKWVNIENNYGYTALLNTLLKPPGKRFEDKDEEGWPLQGSLKIPEGKSLEEFEMEISRDIVKLLLDAGAENMPFRGRPLWQLARDNGHELAAQVLYDHGGWNVG